MTFRQIFDLYDRVTTVATAPASADERFATRGERGRGHGNRRRHPRHRVAWSLRVWFGEELGFATGRANDVSRSGIGLTVSSSSATVLLAPGKSVDVEVYHGYTVVLRRTAVVRHRTGPIVGLEWERPIDEQLLPCTA